jgi:hypothetical protein
LKIEEGEEDVSVFLLDGGRGAEVDKEMEMGGRREIDGEGDDGDMNSVDGVGEKVGQSYPPIVRSNLQRRADTVCHQRLDHRTSAALLPCHRRDLGPHLVSGARAQ